MRLGTVRAAICAVLGVLLAQVLQTPSWSQVVRADPGQREAETAIDLNPAKVKLLVTTPAFKDGGDIPFENTLYRSNTFPGLSWTPGPPGTRSYLLIMQDSDLLYHGAPILHWSLYNIPATTNRLEVGLKVPPMGADFGPNVRGAAQPYMGPRTPPGPKDHFHFEIFALDKILGDPGASYEALRSDMSGHVLASGEIVGLSEMDPNAPAR